MITENVQRVGDMHPNRSLGVYVGEGGDVTVHILQNGVSIGDDFGNESDIAATVEFCVNGGRSVHTRAALMNLIEAIKKDNAERPINAV